MSENPEQGKEVVELSAASLQALVDYYRNRASQLEYEFLQYQLASKATIEKLLRKLQESAQADSTGSEVTTDGSTT